MKQTVRWTAIIALFTIPFIPLLVADGGLIPNMFFPFITGKNFVFRIVVEIALVAWVLLACMDRQYRPRFSWPLVIFGGLVAWMAVANALGVNPFKAFWSNYERMDGWIMLVHVFALFLVTSSVLTVEKLWRRWWLFFVSVAALVCWHGLMQATGSADIHQSDSRVDASFGNAIYMAVYLMFAALAAGWLSVTSKGWVRYALGASALFSTGILLFTGSRGPVIGLAAGVAGASVLWLILSLRDKDTKNMKGLRIAAGGLVALVVLVGGFFLVRDSAFVQETPALQRLSSVFTLSEELKVRSTIWGMALEGVKEDPITGWGQEGFNQVFNKYYDPSLYAQESWFDRAHSMYIDWLVAGGIPALLLFVALLISGGFMLLMAPGYSRAERVILVGMLGAYAVQALVVFDNLFSYVPFVLLLAMAHGAGARPIETLEALPELRSETGMAAGAAVTGVIALAIVWAVNMPGMVGAYHTVYALSPSPKGADENLTYFRHALSDGSFAMQEIREQLVSFAGKASRDESVPEADRAALMQLALSEMEKEIASSPNDARLRMLYAGMFEAAGRNEDALAQIDAALALSPNKQAIHLNRGFKLAELNRMEEARAEFRAAYELDPSFDQVAGAAAAGIVLSGDVAGAKAFLMESVGTTTPDNDSLFYAYYQARQWNELIGVGAARVANENGSVESRFRLVQAYAAAMRYEQARAEILATIAAHPEARAQGEALMAQIFTPAKK